MSDLPSLPGTPSSPFAPWGPGTPCGPFSPGPPGVPIHEHLHAYTYKYCDDFRICLNQVYQYFASVDERC